MGLPERCADLNREHVMHALRSAEAMRTLLSHMAAVAKPREGATKILVPLCQMASKRCVWIDGALTIEIGELENGARTKIVVAVDLGGGMREMVFPKFELGVPWKEFVSAIETAPRLVEPMNVRVKKRAILLAADAESIASLAPPTFAIAEECWRRSLPPAVRRSLAPPVAVDMPAIGEAELLATARLKAPAAPVVDDDDLAELRRAAPPPKKKIVIRKKT